jgi:hypothetical protein
MKRFLLIALCASLVLAFGTTQVMADAYNITTNFGVRVTEQGSSERVGSLTIAPQEIGVDTFTIATSAGGVITLNQVITVELLGGATISRTFGADYAWDGGDAIDSFDPTDALTIPNPDSIANGGNDAAYRVYAVEGQDFFTIEIYDVANSIAAGSTVVVGHDEPTAPNAFSALCYNLVGTIYTPTDPSRQLVQNSYRDNISSTFSGDINIATVKAKSVVIGLCAKAMPTDILIPDTLSQGEDCGLGSGSACIFTFEDNASGALDGAYEFTVGKTTGAKAGVGFNTLTVEKYDSVGDIWNVIPTATVERHNSAGTTIILADFTSAEELWAATSEIVVGATLTGPGLYRMQATYEFDTCVATAGIWTIDIYANKTPCGGSFSELNWNAVEFYTPSGIPTTALFPYAAASGANWFNGLVLTNTTSISITVTCTMVESDGDTYTASIVIPAQNMAIGLVADLLSPTTTGTDSAFGDEPYAIYATSDGGFDGLLFIGDGTMAQGYLPRLSTP